MQLQLDLSKSYALALEGGGAKGAYQIGAWKALKEAGIKLSAVSGTSVGALNGALITMDDLDMAIRCWEEIRYSQIMDVDDEAMQTIMDGDFKKLDPKVLWEHLRSTVEKGGFDVTPLLNLVKSVVDEAKIRSSPIEFYITTYSLSDRKELELRAKDLEEGTIPDMLLASAYLPVFKNEPLGGKRYADGGFRDVLPLHVLISNGCRNIIAIRLYGIGLERKVKIPEDCVIETIAPRIDLGNTLEFNAERSRLNLRAGYFDAQRLLYGLKGNHFYVDNEWSERECYELLEGILFCHLKKLGKDIPLRELHEHILPTLAKRIEAEKGDYRDLVVPVLETMAIDAQLDPWQIYTTASLSEALHAFFGSEGVSPSLLEDLGPRKILGGIELPGLE